MCIERNIARSDFALQRYAFFSALLPSTRKYQTQQNHITLNFNTLPFYQQRKYQGSSKCKITKYVSFYGKTMLMTVKLTYILSCARYKADHCQTYVRCLSAPRHIPVWTGTWRGADGGLTGGWQRSARILTGRITKWDWQTKKGCVLHRTHPSHQLLTKIKIINKTYYYLSKHTIDYLLRSTAK